MFLSLKISNVLDFLFGQVNLSSNDGQYSLCLHRPNEKFHPDWIVEIVKYPP